MRLDGWVERLIQQLRESLRRLKWGSGTMLNRDFSVGVTAAAVAALLALSWFGIEPTAAAQAKAAGLPAILAEMNAASAKFTSAQADLRQELFTRAIHDTETSSGQIYFLRKGGATQMGMKMMAPDAAAGAAAVKIVQFKDGVLQVLNTGTSQVDQFPATGKNLTNTETAMTLGFGGSGTDLQKAWTITDQGSEKMDEGGKQVEVEKLDLIPKDQGIRNIYSHITIWVDPVRDVSLKQVSFDASSGDTRTVIYSNIRLNQTVDAAPFAIKCKGKCAVVNH
jgi:outer membrane lipoprotein-sorting protein